MPSRAQRENLADVKYPIMGYGEEEYPSPEGVVIAYAKNISYAIDIVDALIYKHRKQWFGIGVERDGADRENYPPIRCARLFYDPKTGGSVTWR